MTPLTKSQIAEKAISDPVNLTKEEVDKLYSKMPLVAQSVWENVLVLKRKKEVN